MTTKEEFFGEPFDVYSYVELSPEEVDRLRDLAKSIYYSNIVSQKEDFDKTTLSNKIGLSGEFAFSKYYDLPFRDSVFKGGDDYDFKVYDRVSEQTGTIDVKTISYHNGDMIIQSTRELKADVYFLVEKRGDAYGLIGYQKRSQVAQADSHPPGEYSPVGVKRIAREALQAPPEPQQLETAEM